MKLNMQFKVGSSTKLPSIALAMCGLAFTACHSNPYPDQGQLTEKPTERKPVEPRYGIEVQDVLEFSEGRKDSYPLTAHVDAPGQAIIALAGLPPTASYDPVKGVLTWQPGFDAADDANDPMQIQKDYRLMISVSNSLNPVFQTTKVIILRVHDMPRGFAASGFDSTMDVTEGQKLSKTLVINNVDFPVGPFRVIPDSLPEGAVLRADPNDPTKILLEYQPNYRVVMLGATSGSTTSKATGRKKSWYDSKKEFKVVVNVYDPRGHKIEVPTTITVTDARQKPELVAPTTVKQGLDVSLAVSTQDPNGEVVPQVTLKEKPNFGDWSLDLISSGPATNIRNPYSTFVIRGRNIPSSANGTTASVEVESCVWGASYYQHNLDNCVSQRVNIQFAADLHKLPIIDRANWQFGTFLSFRVGTSLKVNLPIKDGEGRSEEPKVEVTADDPNVQASWRNDELTVKSGTTGQFKLEVTATSAYGLVTRESFWIEVLSQNWPTLLMVGESVRDGEYVKMQGLSDDLQLLNPDLQPLDARGLSGRRGFVLGTNAFAANSMFGAIEKAAGSLPLIFVASPRIGKLNGALLAEINALGVTIAPSRLKLPCGPNCGDVTADVVWTGSNTLNPKGTLTLNGNLTSESAQPQPLILDAQKTACTPLLKLNGVGGTGASFVVAAQCKRSNGGRIIISGVEWADIKPVLSEDQSIVATWFKELMK